jgi:hypothetical protein
MWFDEPNFFQRLWMAGAFGKNSLCEFAVGVEEGEAVTLFDVLSHDDPQKHRFAHTCAPNHDCMAGALLKVPVNGEAETGWVGGVLGKAP